MSVRAEDGNQPHTGEAKQQRKGIDFDTVKLVGIAALVAAGVYGNSYFREESVLYRAIALVALAILCGFIAFHTAKVQAAWNLLNEARTELRRVHFPTRRETSWTTMVVIIVMIVVAVVLFVFDSLLSLLVESLIG